MAPDEEGAVMESSSAVTERQRVHNLMRGPGNRTLREQVKFMLANKDFKQIAEILIASGENASNHAVRYMFKGS